MEAVGQIGVEHRFAARFDFLRFCHIFKQFINHLIHRDSFRLGTIAHQDTMPQDWLCQMLEIFEGNVGATVQQGAGFRAQYKTLSCSQPSPPGDPLIDELRSALLLGATGGRQPNRVSDQRFPDGNPCRNVMKRDQIVGRK